jgi:hypothetical protein
VDHFERATGLFLEKYSGQHSLALFLIGWMFDHAHYDELCVLKYAAMFVATTQSNNMQ